MQLEEMEANASKAVALLKALANERGCLFCASCWSANCQWGSSTSDWD